MITLAVVLTLPAATIVKCYQFRILMGKLRLSQYSWEKLGHLVAASPARTGGQLGNVCLEQEPSVPCTGEFPGPPLPPQVHPSRLHSLPAYHLTGEAGDRMLLMQGQVTPPWTLLTDGLQQHRVPACWVEKSCDLRSPTRLPPQERAERRGAGRLHCWGRSKWREQRG